VNVARATALFSLGVLSTATAGALAWIVPGVANTTGVNGPEYWSDLTLSNPGSSPLTVTLSLIPAPDTVRVEPHGYTIAPGSTLSIPNVLQTAWQVRGTGALRVEADSRIDIFARTYRLFITILPLYGGTSLPVIEESQLLAPGDAGHSAWVEQTLQPGQESHTNVAVTFPGPAGGTADVTLYGESGTAFGSVHLDSSVPAFLQRPLAAFGPFALSIGRVAIRVTRGMACGYTGLVDEASGDVSILAAEPLPPAPSLPSMVDRISAGIAQTRGQLGSFWQTDARLANPGTNAVSVTGYLLTGAGPTVGAGAFSVLAGQTIEVRNLIQSLFNVSGSVSGAVLWRASGPLAIATFTRDAAQGMVTGASHNAVALERFTMSDDTSPEDTELRSGDARTNLLAAAGPGGAIYDLDAYSRDGQSLGTVHQSLPPLASSQFPLPALFPGATQPTRVRVRVESGSVNVQAAVVGNFGGDLLFHEASPRGSGTRSSKPPIPAGSWGGAPNGMDHLSVDSKSIEIFRHCQSGSFPQPLRLDSEGRFAVLGTYSVSVGPGIQFDAILSGQLTEGSVTVRVLPLGSSSGVDTNPETFALGAPFQPFNGVCPIEY